MTGRLNVPATLMGMFSTFTFTSADGTELLGWTNNGTGPDVVVCNGLGVPPEAWPRLLDPHCGYRVVGWNHRGGLGSGRPADPDRIRVEDHVADALALMAHTKVDRALLVAWSLGVNVSFEIADGEFFALQVFSAADSGTEQFRSWWAQANEAFLSARFSKTSKKPRSYFVAANLHSRIKSNTSSAIRFFATLRTRFSPITTDA